MVIYRAHWQYLPMTTSSIILKRFDVDVSDRLMSQVDDWYVMKNYAGLSEEDRKTIYIAFNHCFY